MSDMKYHEFWDALAPAYPLSKGTLRLPIATHITSLEPFLSRDFFDDLESILKTLLQNTSRTLAISRLESENDENLIPLLEGAYTGIIRFDCMLDANNAPKIIEINADYPDGLLLHDSTVCVLSGSENRRHETLFLALFDPLDTIFIAFPDNAFFRDAYEREYLALKNAGFRVYIGNYEGLERRGDTIFYHEHPISVIRRNTETGKMQPQHIALLAGANVRYINTFDIRTLGYKSVLSEITHTLIPQSAILSKENRHLWTQKDRWVVKPSNLSEGRGILIGADTPLEDWQQFLDTPPENTYIVQEYIQSPLREFSFFDAESRITKRVYFDFCPHFFVKNGEILGRGHTLMRFSENKILNVAQGGGIGYAA